MYQFSKNNENETHIWNETRKSHWLDICITYLVGNFFDRSSFGESKFNIYVEIRHLGAENHISGLKWKSEMKFRLSYQKIIWTDVSIFLLVYCLLDFVVNCCYGHIICGNWESREFQ